MITQDILITDDKLKVMFCKKMWHDSELVLAKCYNFFIDVENGIIVATLTHTDRQALFNFIRISFKSFSESMAQVDRRDAFYAEIDQLYANISSYVTQQVESTVPYSNKFYKHQWEGLRFAFFNRVVFIAYTMRLGKSIIAASLSRIFNFRRTLIVCPSVAKIGWFVDMTNPPEKKGWGFEQMWFTVLDASKSKTFYALDERFVICNYDVLDKFMPYLLQDRFDHIIIDECFVYDTDILTNKGLLKIGDIVKNEIKCSVLSFDSLTNAYIYKPVSKWLKKPLNKPLVKITVNGREIICTEDHKIWTRSGFKRAKDLYDTDELCVLRQSFCDQNKRENYSEILLEKVFCRTSIIESITPSSIKRRSSEAKSGINMRSVFKKILSSTISFGSKILQYLMFSNMENERLVYKGAAKTIRQRKGFFEFKKVSSGKSRFRQKMFSAHDGKKSNDEFRREEKNDFQFNRKNIPVSGRERSSNQTAVDHPRINSMAYGISDSVKSSEGIFSECSEKLQSRSSYSRTQNSGRDRRKNSQVEEMEIFGQEENGNFEFVRMESCAILERGGDSESSEMYKHGYVYDLTVEDTHNYFANGLLVSNCHRIKNRHSNRYAMLDRLTEAHNNPKITFLSGTAIPNRFNDLFAYFKLAKHHLGDNYKKFCDEFTITVASRGGDKVKGAKNIAELKMKIQNFMIVRTMDDCFDMPEDIVSRLTFEMDDYKPEYDRIIAEMAAQKALSSLNSSLHSLNILVSKSKIKGTIDVLEDIITENGKVVVFGGYKEPIAMLEAYFGDRCVVVDGSKSANEKYALRTRFTEDPACQVFIGNYQAAGEALDLSIASDIYTLNFPFTPRELQQALFRCKHPEKMKHLRIHYSFCEGSIDEHLFDLVASKARDINALLHDDKEVVNLENLTEVLIKKLLNRDDIVFENFKHKVPVLPTGEEVQESSEITERQDPIGEKQEAQLPPDVSIDNGRSVYTNPIFVDAKDVSKIQPEAERGVQGIWSDTSDNTGRGVGQRSDTKDGLTSTPQYHLMLDTTSDNLFIMNEHEFNTIQSKLEFEVLDLKFSHNDINQVIMQGRHKQMYLKGGFNDKYTPNQEPFFCGPTTFNARTGESKYRDSNGVWKDIPDWKLDPKDFKSSVLVIDQSKIQQFKMPDFL